MVADIKRIIKHAQDQGWKVRWSNNNHPEFRHPEVREIIRGAPASTATPRGFRNLEAELARTKKYSKIKATAKPKNGRVVAPVTRALPPLEPDPEPVVATPIPEPVQERVNESVLLPRRTPRPRQQRQAPDPIDYLQSQIQKLSELRDLLPMLREKLMEIVTAIDNFSGDNKSPRHKIPQHVEDPQDLVKIPGIRDDYCYSAKLRSVLRQQKKGTLRMLRPNSYGWTMVTATGGKVCWNEARILDLLTAPTN